MRRLLFEAGDDIEDLMKLCSADITTKDSKKQERYLQNFEEVKRKLVELEEKDKVRNFQPPVSGEEIINYFKIKPSKEVGIIKNAIKDAILDGKIENNKKDAFKFMIEKGAELGLVTK